MALGALMEVYDLAGGGSAATLAPRRAALQGLAEVRSVQLWTAVDDDAVAVLTCDVASLAGVDEALARAAGTQPAGLRTRYRGEQILPGDLVGPQAAGGLLFLAMDVAASVDEEFNAWNDTEHFPRLAAVPGVLAARRVRCLPGSQRYLAVYHATAPGIIDSPPWLDARETPWTHRIRTFTSHRMRIVCRPA